MTTASVGVLVGNPKPASRTLAAARHIARELTGTDPGVVVDVIALGNGLLGRGDPDVSAALAAVTSVDLLVVGSPTYKGSISGVLKVFLDQLGAGALEGVTAVALMLGAGPGHALAPELTLKPVLSELGASTPTRGLYLLDSEWQESDELRRWLSAARRILAPRPSPVGALR
jgi:FMN reductase